MWRAAGSSSPVRSPLPFPRRASCLAHRQSPVAWPWAAYSCSPWPAVTATRSAARPPEPTARSTRPRPCASRSIRRPTVAPPGCLTAQESSTHPIRSGDRTTISASPSFPPAAERSAAWCATSPASATTAPTRSNLRWSPPTAVWRSSRPPAPPARSPRAGKPWRCRPVTTRRPG